MTIPYQHSATELNAAYAATARLGSSIKRADTDARRLTRDQISSLLGWIDCQHCSTFEDRTGEQFPLQAVLDIWHASVVYETFDAWFSEEPAQARRAYRAICRTHKIKHGA